MIMESVHKFFVLPAVQGMIGSAVVGGSLLGFGVATHVINGCPASAQPYVVRGELALAKGDLRRAERVAHDSLDLAGASPCVNVFAAATEFQIMLSKRAAGDADAAEKYRSQCFLHANRGSTLFGMSPRSAALTQACAVSGMGEAVDAPEPIGSSAPSV